MYKKNFLVEGVNYIWIRIPKNASTTIRDHLQRSNTVFKEIIDVDKNKYTFVFSRNPFSRLVSCWVNRTHFGDKKLIKKHSKKRKNKPGKWTNPELLGLSFKEFVNGVCKIKDDKSDHHFRSQHTFIEGLEIDFIGRVENLNKDLENICKKLKHKCQDTKKIKHLKKSNHKSYRQYYDEKMITLVYERYKKDFELFNYTF